MDSNWFKELFINEAKAAKDSKNVGGGSSETVELQSKTVTPTAEEQTITPDEGYDGLSSVTVQAVEVVDELVKLVGQDRVNRLDVVTSIRGDYDVVNGVVLSLIQYSPNTNSMFYNCYSLTTVPLFDTSKVTSMTGMFSSCYSLTTVPLFDTSKVVNMGSMFSNCYSLTTVPLFDTSKVTSMSSMFEKCYSLTDCYLRNIKTNLQVGSGSTWGHLLTVDSLLHLIKELRDTGSLKTLTMGNVNLEKIANTYVKRIEITDEMRAEDDLIDEKLPFEVCESTDEGAMTINDYVASKNWQLK